MTTHNCKLVDADNGLFVVLDFVGLYLTGPLYWQIEDIDEEKAKGSIFHAYKEKGGLSVAHLMAVDATEDPTEPLYANQRR